MSDPLSICNEDECWEAYWALCQGDVGPLAEYLSLETGRLHPLAQRELAKLLLGTHRSHRVPPPIRNSKGTPKKRTLAERRRDREIFDFIAKCKTADPSLKQKECYGKAITHFQIPDDGTGSADEMVRKAFRRGKSARSKFEKFVKAHFQAEK